MYKDTIRVQPPEEEKDTWLEDEEGNLVNCRVDSLKAL